MFPGVLDITTPASYAVREFCKLWDIGIVTIDNPARKISFLCKQERFIDDIVEFLEQTICLFKFRKDVEDNPQMHQAFRVIRIMALHLLNFAGQKTTFSVLKKVVLHPIVLFFHVTLKSPANCIDRIVNKLNDMEHIDTNVSFREKFLGNGNKAIMHVAAIVFHAFALVWCVLAKIRLQILSGDFLQCLNNATRIPVSDVAMELVNVPA